MAGLPPTDTCHDIPPKKAALGSTPTSDPRDLEMSCSGLGLSSENRLDHPPTGIMLGCLGFFFIPGWPRSLFPQLPLKVG